jgi:two-component system copper resistance phosphate regulon response regulator CusR
MNEGMRILLVEDEPEIGAVVQRGLEKAGYRVEWRRDGASAREAAQTTFFALIVLDLMLPLMDGWAVCRELRAARDTTPILMLTARDAVEDRVRGLEMGADDYLTKPFAFSELLARVRALLRRDRIHKTATIQVADLVVDTAARRATRAGRELSLTPREYLLLEALAAREGYVLTRDAILERVWANDDAASNTVDVHVGTLRKKVDAGQAVRLIQTVRGLVYTLRCVPSSDDEDAVP